MPHLFLFAAALATPAPADAALLMPAGKWTIDWGDTNCIALQKYDDTKQPVTFGFKPSINGDVIRLMVSRKGPRQKPAHFEVKVGDVKTTALVFSPKDSGMQLFWINIDRGDFNRLAIEPSIRIGGRQLDLHLSTQGFEAAVKALDSCNADLRSEWNADEEGKARISVPPVALISPVKFLKPEDYPSQAVFEGRDGVTAVSLLLDETGAIKDCVVEQASGVATLDAQTCLLIQQRGKFTAAKDAAGTPVKTRLFYRVRWKTG